MSGYPHSTGIGGNEKAAQAAKEVAEDKTKAEEFIDSIIKEDCKNYIEEKALEIWTYIWALNTSYLNEMVSQPPKQKKHLVKENK